MYDLNDFDSDYGEDSFHGLRESSRHTMMEIIYNTLMNEQDKAINSNTPPEEKLQALNNVIQYFVESEEYEKCHNIKKIIDKIRC
jgi:vacuolar-type H+-ATPase catalytic subunit A/Vma1